MSNFLTAATAIVVLVLTPVTLIAADENDVDRLEEGRALAFERRKGNCLACHQIEGGELAGNFAPPLLLMRARFPDRDVLRAQIWDAAGQNPDTRMPPYGRHRILTEEEIDLVVDFILTL